MQTGENIQHFTLTGLESGVSLLVLGAIHGDEPCGPKAIQRVMEEIEGGKILLEKGTLHCVPVCNPRAFDSSLRYSEDNLNRIFRKTENPQSYEATLANELCELADEADVLLDIHSSHAPAPVNLFVDYPTLENEALAEALNAEYAIYDWPKVYEQSPVALDSHTTDRYAFETGKSGILFEAGQHTDPHAEQTAYEAILRTLIHLGMIEPRENLASARRLTKVFMTKVFVKEGEGDTFTSGWAHLQAIPTGTIVATRASGETITTNEDSVVIFPKAYAKPEGEWFYLGVLDQELGDGNQAY